MQASPVLKHLVLVGGGHSHVEVLRQFAMRPVRGLRITLVSPSSTSAYSGMLPGHVAGHYAADEIHIDLRRLTTAAGARFLRAGVTGMDPEARTLSFDDRPTLSYDLLSLNIGAVPNFGDVAGAREFALPVKPVDRFLERLSDILAESGSQHIGVVGGGAAGVEIALALEYRLRRTSGHRVSLIEAGEEILPSLSAGARRRVRQALSSKGIEIHTGRGVRAVTVDGIDLEGGGAIPLDVVTWATGAMAPNWSTETRLDLDQDGFVLVDQHLRSVSHPDVFAAGDVAVIDGDRLSRAGVYAVRQGRVLAENLRRELLGRATQPYRAQRRFLGLLATGPRHAVASRGMFSASGDWVWRWKDSIDRRFMRRYRDLSFSMSQGPSGDVLPELAAMDAEALMRCKGCGGKLGPGALSMALGRLAASSPAVELSSLDDAAVLKPPPGMVVLQSVDYFPALVSDPFVFGQIAANHCLGDIHAMGAKPWTALALAQVRSGSEEIKQEDLFQMLAGAARVFENEGIALVGGHSVEGDELALGFTVNGLAAPEEVRRKSGLRAGDALILTKPLGTGVLFAAEMRGRAKPGWIDCAVQTMLRSCGPAAVLARHGVTGMTDVTGFGLAGHLGEMLTASKTDAELNLDAIPALDGAIELIEAGIESSLAPGNRERMAALLHDPANGGDARVALLADPQTAGGLLAGVRADQADACVDALKAAGDDARIIGTVTPMRSSAAAFHLS